MTWVLCGKEEEESVAFRSLVFFIDSLEGKK